jgi:hypothetical protein
MIERKPGRFSDEAFVRQLWAERFEFQIPADSFVNKWVGIKSMYIISAFRVAEAFHLRYPSKDSYDICRLVSSTISKSRRIQEAKQQSKDSE